MIVLSRIDSRLIHGQVIEAWVPHLRVQRLVVADDEAAGDPLAQAAMGLAVPASVEVVTRGISAVDYVGLAADGVRTLLLFRNIASAVSARREGLPNGVLNVGNVHSAPGKHAVSRTVFLSGDEEQQLVALDTGGMQVVMQSLPAERPVSWPTVR